MRALLSHWRKKRKRCAGPMVKFVFQLKRTSPRVPPFALFTMVHTASRHRHGQLYSNAATSLPEKAIFLPFCSPIVQSLAKHPVEVTNAPRSSPATKMFTSKPSMNKSRAGRTATDQNIKFQKYNSGTNAAPHSPKKSVHTLYNLVREYKEC